MKNDRNMYRLLLIIFYVTIQLLQYQLLACFAARHRIGGVLNV